MRHPHPPVWDDRKAEMRAVVGQPLSPTHMHVCVGKHTHTQTQARTPIDAKSTHAHTRGKIEGERETCVQFILDLLQLHHVLLDDFLVDLGLREHAHRQRQHTGPDDAHTKHQHKRKAQFTFFMGTQIP